MARRIPDATFGCCVMDSFSKGGGGSRGTCKVCKVGIGRAKLRPWTGQESGAIDEKRGDYMVLTSVASRATYLVA